VAAQDNLATGGSLILTLEVKLIAISELHRVLASKFEPQIPPYMWSDAQQGCHG
jgi:hypothetical protein